MIGIGSIKFIPFFVKNMSISSRSLGILLLSNTLPLLILFNLTKDFLSIFTSDTAKLISL
jgi:hypothetical protein